jgi:hypothetical protein
LHNFGVAFWHVQFVFCLEGHLEDYLVDSDQFRHGDFLDEPPQHVHPIIGNALAHEMQKIEAVIEDLDVWHQPPRRQPSHELQNGLLVLIFKGLFDEILAAEGLRAVDEKIHEDLQIVVAQRLLYATHQLKKDLLHTLDKCLHWLSCLDRGRKQLVIG